MQQFRKVHKCLVVMSSMVCVALLPGCGVDGESTLAVERSNQVQTGSPRDVHANEEGVIFNNTDIGSRHRYNEPPREGRTEIFDTPEPIPVEMRADWGAIAALLGIQVTVSEPIRWVNEDVQNVEFRNAEFPVSAVLQQMNEGQTPLFFNDENKSEMKSYSNGDLSLKVDVGSNSSRGYYMSSTGLLLVFNFGVPMSEVSSSVEDVDLLLAAAFKIAANR